MQAYAIKSSLTGKYLNFLFQDEHNKMFQAAKFKRGECYWYISRDAAQRVATEFGGTLEVIEIQ